jgi:hypothetical protein
LAAVTAPSKNTRYIFTVSIVDTGIKLVVTGVYWRVNLQVYFLIGFVSFCVFVDLNTNTILVHNVYDERCSLDKFV